jgi:hypothetical protein
MFLGLLDSDPDPLFRGTHLDQDPSITKQNRRKTLIPTVLWLLYDFLSKKMVQKYLQKVISRKNSFLLAS